MGPAPHAAALVGIQRGSGKPLHLQAHLGGFLMLAAWQRPCGYRAGAVYGGLPIS